PELPDVASPLERLAGKKDARAPHRWRHKECHPPVSQKRSPDDLPNPPVRYACAVALSHHQFQCCAIVPAHAEPATTVAAPLAVAPTRELNPPTRPIQHPDPRSSNPN